MPLTQEEIKEILLSTDEIIRRLSWSEFWMNRMLAWLYGGYREDYKDCPFPMDN